MALMASGCASLQSGFVKQEVLSLYHDVQQWPEGQAGRELPLLETAYSRAPSDNNRLRLAVVLAFAECAECERERGAQLLQETIEKGAHPSTVALASLFSEVIESRAKLAAAIAAQREAEASRAAVVVEPAPELAQTRAKLAESKKQLAKEQQRVKELQKKLDALTTIEKSLHQRE